MVTELGTGLGMLGYSMIDEALRAPPNELVSVARLRSTCPSITFT
jgi:hypothetical protein